MANTSSARKRARQAVTRRGHNVGMRSMMRTYIKNVYKAVQTGDKAAAESAYKEALPVIDKMSGKGLIHANKAARHKSRMNSNIRNMQG